VVDRPLLCRKDPQNNGQEIHAAATTNNFVNDNGHMIARIKKRKRQAQSPTTIRQNKAVTVDNSSLRDQILTRNSEIACRGRGNEMNPKHTWGKRRRETSDIEPVKSRNSAKM